MGSVTKNPMLLQSAQYIYSWFQSKINNAEDAKLFNMLEVSDSDKYVVSNIKKNNINKNNYENISVRNNKLDEVLDEYNK